MRKGKGRFLGACLYFRYACRKAVGKDFPVSYSGLGLFICNRPVETAVINAQLSPCPVRIVHHKGLVRILRIFDGYDALRRLTALLRRRYLDYLVYRNEDPLRHIVCAGVKVCPDIVVHSLGLVIREDTYRITFCPGKCMDPVLCVSVLYLGRYGEISLEYKCLAADG